MALAPNTTPIQAVLELLPYTSTVLDPKLLDQITLSLSGSVSRKMLCNGYIVRLLAFLADSGLVELSMVEPVSSTGRIYFIKKL